MVGKNVDVIYDELGINICTTFDLGINIPMDYPTATVGISLVVQSLYFASYKVPTEGKVDTPKGSTIPSQETAFKSNSIFCSFKA